MALRRKKSVIETPRRRRIRRRRLIIKSILLFIVATILISGIIVLFRLPQLQISEIEVVGAETIDSETIKNTAAEISSGNYVYFLPKNHILLYPTDDIEEKLKNDFKEIAEVKVGRTGLRSTKISIIERSAVAVFCDSSCYLADNQGLLFKPAGIILNGEMPTFRNTGEAFQIGTSPMESQTFSQVLDFVKKVGEMGFVINEISLEPEGVARISSEQGSIVFSIDQPLPEQLSILQSAVSESVFHNEDGSIKNFDYIDLRFGKKVFYKMI